MSDNKQKLTPPFAIAKKNGGKVLTQIWELRKKSEKKRKPTKVGKQILRELVHSRADQKPKKITYQH
ncbi:hypothetical protein QCD60_28655 [Pokkaliibacter sp. MBI-7]|uniref:hypothetical protein n=1 Tax=Pokkaliibacter sp. MBI-7 TaxID=3040600 RepID=UPI002448B9D5|nr:hypothetical protein [Pokkaliibacter sp. MBI-7]MDH2436488.1 hypothetical protein [Pokkaliibacter sp. MBI-7]